MKLICVREKNTRNVKRVNVGIAENLVKNGYHYVSKGVWRRFMKGRAE